MDSGKTREAYESYSAAKNAGDVDRAMQLCAPEIVYRNASDPDTTVEGWEAVKGYFARFNDAIPGYQVDRLGTVVDGETVVAWGRMRGIVAQGLMGPETVGRELDLPILFVCRFRDGLMVEETGWFDSKSMATQLGLDQAGTAGRQQTDAESYRRNWERAWEDPTPEKLGGLWHRDVEVLYPGIDEPTDHRGAVDFWRTVFETMKDFRLRAVTWVASGDDVAIELEVSATVAGQRLTWQNVDMVKLRGDRAISIRAYGDVSEVLDALASAAPS